MCRAGREKASNRAAQSGTEVLHSQGVEEIIISIQKLPRKKIPRKYPGYWLGPLVGSVKRLTPYLKTAWSVYDNVDAVSSVCPVFCDSECLSKISLFLCLV